MSTLTGEAADIPVRGNIGVRVSVFAVTLSTSIERRCFFKVPVLDVTI